MKSNAELWSRIHALLDERRDPFDDEALRRGLEGDPDLLEEVVHLRANLNLLGHTRPRQRSRRRWLLPLAASLVGILITALVVQLPRASDGTDSGAAGAAGAGQSVRVRGRVLSFELEVETTAPGRRVTTTHMDDGRTLRSIAPSVPSCRAAT